MITNTRTHDPLLVGVIDFNTEEAAVACGHTLGPYPRFLPCPSGCIGKNDKALTLQPWRRNLLFFPQLYVILLDDVPFGGLSAAQAARIGVGIGVALLDDGIVQASKDGEPRDNAICHWYSQFSDDSQMLSVQYICDDLDLRAVTLTISSETMGIHEFPQKDMRFDARAVLLGMSRLTAFASGDIITLGACVPPVAVGFDKRFGELENVIVDGGGMGKFEFTVEDKRSQDSAIPGFVFREFSLKHE